METKRAIDENHKLGISLVLNKLGENKSIKKVINECWIILWQGNQIRINGKRIWTRKHYAKRALIDHISWHPIKDPKDIFFLRLSYQQIKAVVENLEETGDLLFKNLNQGFVPGITKIGQ